MVSVPEYFNFATDIFDGWATKSPDSNALWWVSEDGTNERCFTFAELRELSIRAAGAMHHSGVEAGQPVLLMLTRRPEWWMAMLALIRLGAIPVPCTPQLTAHDLSYRLNEGAIRATITDNLGASKLVGFEGSGFWVLRDRVTKIILIKIYSLLNRGGGIIFSQHHGIFKKVVFAEARG